MNKPTFKKLTALQIVDLHDKLKQVCSKGEDGSAIYIDGYNDRKVYEELLAEGKNYNLSGIEKIRRDFFGRVRSLPTKEETSLNKISSQISTLIDITGKLGIEVENLKKWAAARPVQPYK